MHKADYESTRKLVLNRRAKLKGDISLGMNTVLYKYMWEANAKERESMNHNIIMNKDDIKCPFAHLAWK